MHLTPRQRTVLIGILEDERNLTRMPVDGPVGSRLERGRRRIVMRNARAGLVPMNLTGWLGHVPTNSEHVLYHREYARLEDMGLIHRCNLSGGRRTTHLRLMPAGRRIAETLLAEEYGSDDEDADEVIDWSNVEFLPIEIPLESGEPGDHMSFG